MVLQVCSSQSSYRYRRRTVQQLLRRHLQTSSSACPFLLGWHSGSYTVSSSGHLQMANDSVSLLAPHSIDSKDKVSHRMMLYDITHIGCKLLPTSADTARNICGGFSTSSAGLVCCHHLHHKRKDDKKRYHLTRHRRSDLHLLFLL